MMEKSRELIYKLRWFIIAFWVLITLSVLIFAPNLSEKTESNQESFLTEEASPTKANKMINELFPDRGGKSTALITFQREKGFTQKDREFAKSLEDYLVKNKSKLHVREIISPFSNKMLESQMMNKKKDAAIMSVGLNISSYSETGYSVILKIKGFIKNGFNLSNGKEIIAPNGLVMHMTGDATMGQEEKENVDKSLDTMVKFTIVLILAILLLIYRSPIAPLLSLGSIGISYAISRGIIAALADVGLKVSTFTETFLVAIIFGAGTDYCLLMISRYKEELMSGADSKTAIMTAMKGTGKAIISSGGTVIIGFCCMIFAKFGLFNTTGPSVAIGVAITLLAVLTLVPSLIAVLGDKIFWPKKYEGKVHGKTRSHSIWSYIAKTVTRKPIRFIIIPLLCFLPFIISSFWILPSYDQLSDLPEASESRKGFDVIKENFNQGEMLPIKIVMKSDKVDMWSNDSLQLIDKIADNVSRIDKVVKVRTATRPLGDKLTAVSLSKQIKLLSKGLGLIQAGFSPVVEGLNTVQININKISDGVKTGGTKIGDLSGATGKINNGLYDIGDGIGGIGKGAKSSADGLVQINNSIDLLTAGITQSKDGISSMSENLVTAKSSLEALLEQQPALATNQNFQTSYGIVSAVTENTAAIIAGLDQTKSAMGSLKNAITGVKNGSLVMSNGLKDINDALTKITDSLKLLQDGQKKAGEQLKIAADGLSQIADGLETGKIALTKMGSGMENVTDATGSYTSEKSTLKELFYLPKGALEKYPELKKAMDNYISPNKKGVTFDVILSVGPFSEKALDLVDEINKIVNDTIRKTSFNEAEFHLGGATAVFNSVRELTTKDMMVVMIIVLLGIFLVLIILLRSLISPIYIIFTIILSYLTTMGITYFVFQVIMGHDGLSWPVQFFVFCILVALGIDYNIFLMARVKEEYSPGKVRAGVTRALARTGSIITSCGIIMVGTFASMLFSSTINSIIQIGFAAVVGLVLDTFIVRTLIVPAIAVKFGEMNWWPGQKVGVIHASKIHPSQIESDSEHEIEKKHE